MCIVFYLWSSWPHACVSVCLFGITVCQFLHLLLSFPWTRNFTNITVVYPAVLMGDLGLPREAISHCTCFVFIWLRCMTLTCLSVTSRICLHSCPSLIIAAEVFLCVFVCVCVCVCVCLCVCVYVAYVI